jgi:WD40 repeat protein
MHQRLVLPLAGLTYRPVALASDGSWLAAQDGDPARTAGVLLWDVASGRELASWSVDGPVRNLASSCDGGILIVGTKESPEAPTHRIHLWNVPPAAPAVTLITDLPASWQVVLAPDGERLATVGRDGVVQIWRVPTRSIERVFDVRERPVRSLAFSPDGKLLAGGTLYGSVLLWDVETGQERSELKAEQRGVRLLAFAPDGRTLATGTLDEPILLWDVPGAPALESERIPVSRPSIPGESQK